MKLDNLMTIEQIESFSEGSQAIAFAVSSSKVERYQCIDKILKRFGYANLTRRDKGVMRDFLMKITSYSRPQITRIIERYRTNKGPLKPRQKTVNGFESIYSPEDIKLLARLDQRHDIPNGLRVKKLCERAYKLFGDADYRRLSQISVSHIYNLRKANHYKKHIFHYEKTKSVKAPHIGERRKPNNEGKPGYIRIDTVHQGDLDGEKGVYHINAVDEVTQFEVVVCVEKISEAYLIPALTLLLDSFPFKIINFHSDNGSEYVNKKVAKLLKKLLIEFTKSRPRQSGDNALAEGKNAAVVRKIYGYAHIPQHFASMLNEFNNSILNPYVNYHRPCLYPTVIIDDKGKQKKKYDYQNMMTPYEKLKSLPNAQKCLREDINFEKLDDISNAITDNEAADLLQEQRKLLFKQIHEDCNLSA